VGRDEHLGLEPGRLHERRFAHLGRQHAVGDEEHVAVEPGALVASPHLRDHAGDAHPPAGARELPLEGDDVVELDVGLGRDSDPELERGGVLGADHPSDDGPRERLVRARSGHGSDLSEGL
jgi:hypothetical protein